MSNVEDLSTYGLEADIPVPRPRRDGLIGKSPMEHMSVGNSFFVPWTDYTTSMVMQVCHRRAVELGIKITCRESHKEKGVRVWRLA